MTLDEIGSFLATAGVGTVGTTIFPGRMPPSPDACVAIYEYPGRSPDHVFGTSAISTEYPRVQVVARGAAHDYETPRTTAETAYKAMAAAGAQTISSTRYVAFTPLQPPFLLRRDENERVEIAFNVEVMKGLSA